MLHTFRLTIIARSVHYITTFPGDLNAAATKVTVEPTSDGSEHKVAAIMGVELHVRELSTAMATGQGAESAAP